MPEYRLREASDNEFDVSVEQGTFGDYEVYGLYANPDQDDGSADDFEIFIVTTGQDVRSASVIFRHRSSRPGQFSSRCITARDGRTSHVA